LLLACVMRPISPRSCCARSTGNATTRLPFVSAAEMRHHWSAGLEINGCASHYVLIVATLVAGFAFPARWLIATTPTEPKPKRFAATIQNRLHAAAGEVGEGGSPNRVGMTLDVTRDVLGGVQLLLILMLARRRGMRDHAVALSKKLLGAGFSFVFMVCCDLCAESSAGNLWPPHGAGYGLSVQGWGSCWVTGRRCLRWSG